MELSTLSWKGGSVLGKISGTSKLYRLTGRRELAVGNRPKQLKCTRIGGFTCFRSAVRQEGPHPAKQRGDTLDFIVSCEISGAFWPCCRAQTGHVACQCVPQAEGSQPGSLRNLHRQLYFDLLTS